jgi:hypothetical protein
MTGSKSGSERLDGPQWRSPTVCYRAVVRVETTPSLYTSFVVLKSRPLIRSINLFLVLILFGKRWRVTRTERSSGQLSSSIWRCQPRSEFALKLAV